MTDIDPARVEEDADRVEVVASEPIRVRSVAFILISAVAVIWLLQMMQSVLVPFVVSGLLFYALDPAVDWLQARRLPRAIAATLVLLIVVAGCGALAYSLQGQAFAVIDQL